MNTEQHIKYRVIATFDRWTSDAVANHDDEVARACADGRPAALLGGAVYQDVILGGTFDHAPTPDEIGLAIAVAAALAYACDGRAEPCGHHVLDENAWWRLVGTRTTAIDAAKMRHREAGLPPAAIAGTYGDAESTSWAIATALSARQEGRGRPRLAT